MKNKETNLSPWIWPAFFLFLWQVLLLAQNPGLMSDDSGEMAAASYVLGLPHPPGYPLFCLLGRLVTLLPVGTVAFRLNLFSALLVLISLWFILDTCRRSIDRKFMGARKGLFFELLLMVLALGLVSNRSLFSQCLTAKGCIYSLTLLLTTLVVWVWVRHKGTPAGWSGLLFPVFLWGAGMANHWPTQVFWVLYLVLIFRKAIPKPRAKTLFFAMTVGLMGLSLYLYLPLRTLWNPTPCWGNPVHLEGFYWVVSRRLVAGLEPLIQSPAFYVATLKEFTRIIFLFWPPWSLFLGLLGVVVLWTSKRDLFLGPALLFFPIFLAVLAVHEEKNIYLVHVYLLSLSGIAGLFVFWGSVELTRGFKNKTAWMILTGLGIISGAWLVHAHQLEDKSRYILAEDFGTNALKVLPRGALLLADGDHYAMPIWYERSVKGQRPDILFEPSVFLYHGWGWKQLMAQSKDMEPLILSTNTFPGRLDALANRDGAHPFFYSLGTSYLAPVLKQVPGYLEPWGLLYRWISDPAGKGARPMGPKGLGAIQRTRGLSDWAGRPEVDFSTQILFRYYDQQKAQEGL